MPTFRSFPVFSIGLFFLGSREKGPRPPGAFSLRDLSPEGLPDQEGPFFSPSISEGCYPPIQGPPGSPFFLTNTCFSKILGQSREELASGGPRRMSSLYPLSGDGWVTPADPCQETFPISQPPKQQLRVRALDPQVGTNQVLNVFPSGLFKASAALSVG